MTQLHEIYKCEVCGNIVEMVHASAGQLVCCGKPMKLMVENTSDGAKEKHVPVIEKTDKSYKVKIGSVPHPMEAKHYIEWIELAVDGIIHKKFLAPGQPPEAEFCYCDCCPQNAKTVAAREYCNLHGLWKGGN